MTRILSLLFILILHIPICFSFADAHRPDPQNRRPKTILALGDSLTAGYGLEISSSYPNLLEQLLSEKKLNYKVVNAGVSGDTSAGGLRRLPWLLKQDISILIIALGANDGLRGFSPNVTRGNLSKIIDLARELKPDIKILLAGMLAPPNMGSKYTSLFEDIYPSIATEKKVPLLPFLLQGVAGEVEYNLPDGIHPNEAGYRKVSKLVFSHLEPIISEQE